MVFTCDPTETSRITLSLSNRFGKKLFTAPDLSSETRIALRELVIQETGCTNFNVELLIPFEKDITLVVNRLFTELYQLKEFSTKYIYEKVIVDAKTKIELIFSVDKTIHYLYCDNWSSKITTLVDDIISKTLKPALIFNETSD